MTQEEKKIKSYVNAIERRLRLPLKMKQRLNMDLGTDIHARLESGKSVDEVIEELGTPEEVARRLNKEMEEYVLPKNKTSSAIFLVLLVLAAAYTIFVLWESIYLQKFISIIGGADGPTSIFIAGKMVSPWQRIFFIGTVVLGLLSAFLMACYGSRAEQTVYKRCVILSASGLVLWFLGFIVLARTDGTEGAMAQWFFQIPFRLNLTFLLEFIFVIVTLIVSIRWWRRAKMREANEG